MKKPIKIPTRRLGKLAAPWSEADRDQAVKYIAEIKKECLSNCIADNESPFNYEVNTSIMEVEE